MTADRRVQVQLSATLLFAVLLTTGLGFAAAPRRSAAACTRLVVASSAEKYGLLSGFAATYNGSGRVVGGRCVRVAVELVNSGDAELALESGWKGQTSARPDVWSPASRAWVTLLGARSDSGAGLVPADYQSLFQSPTVIGMPQPMADALGYPATQIGWTDIARLIADPAGWGAVNHPEWGQFRLGKTNPTISTSGLHSLIATYFAAGGRLTAAEVNAPPVHDFVAGIESGVVHYGETASDFLLGLRDADNRSSATGYISAVAIEEKELVDYNRGVIEGTHYGVPRTPLVAIYPKEGTLVADHPYVVLRWSREQDAAADFFAFLTEPAQQELVEAQGFRNRFGNAGPALARLLIQPDQLTRVVVPPAGSALVAMLDVWQRLRKPARVLILVDRAAAPDILRQALASLGDAVIRFQPTDLAGVWTFPAPATSATPYVELLPVSPTSPRLGAVLAGIRPVPGAGQLDSALRAAVAAMGASYDPPSSMLCSWSRCHPTRRVRSPTYPLSRRSVPSRPPPRCGFSRSVRREAAGFVTSRLPARASPTSRGLPPTF